jgi:hypothetical protein
VIVPIVVGALAYGAAWLMGLVGFEGSVGDLMRGVFVAATLIALYGCIFTAGE